MSIPSFGNYHSLLLIAGKRFYQDFSENLDSFEEIFLLTIYDMQHIRL